MPVSKAQPETIEFGRHMTAANLETYWLWLVHCFGSNGTWKVLAADTHPLGVIFWYLRDAWPRMTSNTGVYDKTDTNIKAEQIFMNLGRLIRKKSDDDAQLYTIKNMVSELRKTYDGQANSEATLSALVSALCSLWFLVGENLEDMFGTWDNTKYLRQDDAFAGWICALQWVVLFLNLADISYMRRERAMAEYSIENGVVKAHYREFNPSDPTTYGSIFSIHENEGDVENSTPKDYFGLKAEYVDEPLTKGFKIMVHDGAEKLANKLLTETEFPWKFNRTVKIIPEFIIYQPTAEANKGVTVDDMATASMENRPMVNGTNIYNLTIRREVIELVSDFKSYFFKNKSFALHKKKYTLKSIYDLPIPTAGNGGLAAFQTSVLYDISAIASDKINKKFILDTTDNGILRISMRRSTHHNARYQYIGDMDISDLLIQLAAVMSDVYIDGAKETLTLTKWFRPVGGFGLALYREEDQPWKATRVFYSLVGGATYKTDFDGIANIMSPWEYVASFTYKTTQKNYPEAIIHSKALWYYGRAADPWKKLTHHVIDVNQFDFTEISAVIRDVFSYSGGGGEEIPVSAIPDKDDKPDFLKKEDDDTAVSAIPDKKVEEDEQPVSAVPDAQKKVDKAQKEVTKAKKDLSDEKKKEDKKKKQEKK